MVALEANEISRSHSHPNSPQSPVMMQNFAPQAQETVNFNVAVLTGAILLFSEIDRLTNIMSYFLYFFFVPYCHCILFKNRLLIMMIFSW